ncbi:GTPase IMAP family member 4-like [Sardina pilchardus]|uniref:GTPase IMAP family member 4-like n=1 Tax=Sardina pilchardus TaxID=27697 RepID=UPI002E0FE592
MMATGGSSAKDERRAVLLGKIGAGKSSFANRLLESEAFKKAETGLCVRRQGEHAGRKLTVVDTPGWDRVSVQRTPEQIKQEIIRSTTLCLPGPHVLLLVLPISMDGGPPSANEIKSASHHVELLSPRAWRHTILLFVCMDEMDESIIEQRVNHVRKLIDKCQGRFFILQRDSQVTKLLQKIEDMVEDNCGDFLIPQVYYEAFERRMPSEITKLTEMYETREEELNQRYRRKLEEKELEFREKLARLQQEEKTGAMKKSGSYQLLPPNLSEITTDRAAVQHQDSEKETVSQNKPEDFITLLRYHIKPFWVIVMAVIGALVGSVVGATDGVKGACVGMVIGSVIGVLLAILYIRATRLVKTDSPGSKATFALGDQSPETFCSPISLKTSEKHKKL